MILRPSFRISFRVTLFSLMMAVLLTAVLLLGVASYLYARFAAENLGQQVLEQTAARVDQHVQHALDIAEYEAKTIEGLMARARLDPADHESGTEYFLAALKALPSLSYLSFGTPAGKYYHVFRDRNGGLSALWLVPQANGDRRLYEFSIASDGTRETVRDIAKSVRTPPYERYYYIAALEAGKALWTESYVFLGSGESLDVPGVSRAVPVYLDDGEFAGVLTADFDLHALSRFLAEIKLGQDGLCFLIENASDGTSRVIAHPAAVDEDPAQRLDLTQAAPDGNGRVTVAADKIPDPRVMGALSALGKESASLSPSLRNITVAVSERGYVGGFRHLGREGGPDWVICMLVPETELFGDVRRMAKLMAALGLFGILIAGALSLLLSRQISSTLGRIARETREIGQFELTAKPPVASRIEEISTLANSVEEMKTSLRSFKKYVPSELVRELLESGQEANLGGARKDLTIYFSDIIGFTSVAEQLTPLQLTKLLSEYLDAMTGEVLKNGGTVDKYIGDAIMAFWGAPKPRQLHAKDACRTALENQSKLAQLRKGWEQDGLPPLRARIGLHTGNAMVGNFGSHNRLDYTAIGDNVNVASRLEGLSRIYGTEVLISESTRKAVADEFLTRPLGKIAVKGREQGIFVYELVAARCRAEEETSKWIEIYSEGLDRYVEREWQSAIEAFESVLAIKPGDRASELMIERCLHYQDTPPEADWSGIFQAPK